MSRKKKRRWKRKEEVRVEGEGGGERGMKTLKKEETEEKM